MNTSKYNQINVQTDKIKKKNWYRFKNGYGKAINIIKNLDLRSEKYIK